LIIAPFATLGLAGRLSDLVTICGLYGGPIDVGPGVLGAKSYCWMLG